MSHEAIAEKSCYQTHCIEIDGSKINYIDQGHGDPVLFLHSIPGSSYSWRNIIPYLTPLARCIAPDLIGIGGSSQPKINYTLDDYIYYTTEFINRLGLKKITLVMHGWGSIIGCNYALQNEGHCKGLVFYEAYLRPFNEENISLPYLEQLRTLQTAADTANATSLLDTIFLQTALNPLPATLKNQYLKAYALDHSQKLLQEYIRELPDANAEGKANTLIAGYADKLTKTQLPKLILYAIPGFITSIATIIWAKKNFSNLEVFEVGEELHYAHEAYPALFGEAISIWLQALEQHH